MSRVPLPDAVTEEQVNIQLTWTADARTQAAIERQARLMGFKSPRAYLKQALAATIADNEEDTAIPLRERLSGCLPTG
jgi:hypothetical protein